MSCGIKSSGSGFSTRWAPESHSSFSQDVYKDVDLLKGWTVVDVVRHYPGLLVRTKVQFHQLQGGLIPDISELPLRVDLR